MVLLKGWGSRSLVAGMAFFMMFDPGSGPIPDSASETAPLALLDSTFWIGKLPEGDALLLNSAQIASYNRLIRSSLPDILIDLASCPQSLPGRVLTDMLTRRRFPDQPLYLKGGLAGPEYFAGLKKLLNLEAVMPDNPVRYALAVSRASLRTFPVAEGAYESPSDNRFDLFQETALEPGEPAIALHASADGLWYFVQTVNYCGWVLASDLAITDDRQQWLEYWQKEPFLVVTGSRIAVHPAGPASQILTVGMGARLPLAAAAAPAAPRAFGAPLSQAGPLPAAEKDFLVKIPVRGRQGELLFALGSVPKTADVSQGYLPYTRANILRQVFKPLGEAYGWGGLGGTRDCSSLVMDVFRTFGIFLPRNADQQEMVPGLKHEFPLDASWEARVRLLAEVNPGSALFMPGHVAVYLGRHEGKDYIIHASSSQNAVCVGTLETLRKGRPMLEVVTTANEFLFMP